MILEKQEFLSLFSDNGMSISDAQYDKLSAYSKLLVEWNERCNLTAILDPYGISVKHFFDSIYPFISLEIPDGAKIIDVGTGAGFPAIPLKIIKEGIEITLLDSLNKRVNFLKKVSDTLELNADCVHARAEEAGQLSQYREKFDVATARAVAALPELCEYCLPFVKVGGIFVSLKGSNGLEEVEKATGAISILGGKLIKSESYKLPNGDGRTLVVVKKISQSPLKYPRNKGQMTKKPL